MSTITVDLNEFDLIKDLSVYNRNYYRHKINHYELYVESNDEGSSRVYLYKHAIKIFLFDYQYHPDDDLNILYGELFLEMT